MPNAENTAASDPTQTGSAATDPASQAASAGESVNTNNGQGAQVDYKAQYEELEKKLGIQGTELGEYRNFFQNITPLLEKLDASPELVQAIVDGKIDQQLAKAVFEGRVDIKDAAIVSQASQQVQSEHGKKAIEAMTPEKVEELVEKRAEALRKELAEAADLKVFEEKTQKFIESTGDFAQFAGQIDSWLESHPDVADVEVAYYAVKGKLSEQEAKNAASDAEAQRNQELVANAPGGGVTAQATPDGTPIIDKLVAGPANPIF